LAAQLALGKYAVKKARDGNERVAVEEKLMHNWVQREHKTKQNHALHTVPSN